MKAFHHTRGELGLRAFFKKKKNVNRSNHENLRTKLKKNVNPTNKAKLLAEYRDDNMVITISYFSVVQEFAFLSVSRIISSYRSQVIHVSSACTNPIDTYIRNFGG